jgi:anti-sigma B factor antagonist
VPTEERTVRAGMLTLETSQYGETRFIRLSGELDLANTRFLEAELDQTLTDGTGQIIIDMAELTFIDSTGIALLVVALGRDGDRSRLRFLRSHAEAVNRVLKLTGIDERLPILDLSVSSTAGASAR